MPNVNLSLSEINVYPIKSLRGVSKQSANVYRTGFQYDRSWMLVDEDHKFITQRQYSKLALVDVDITEKQISLHAPGQAGLIVPNTARQNIIDVKIWSDQCKASVATDAVNEWFSKYLSKRCLLVTMAENYQRAVNPDYRSSSNDIVSFADGYPFLLITEASLAELNKRMQEEGSPAVPMKRFRPNLVVKGTDAHDEDRWKKIKIGDCVFDIVKPCSRCIIPTINTDTGDKAKEPMKTLLTYRKKDSKVYFGQNLIPVYQPGLVLSVGDVVEVIC